MESFSKLAKKVYCVFVKYITLCNCQCSSPSPSRFSAFPGLRNCKLVFLILKISQYGGSRRWAQLFPRYPCKNWYRNWYLHFYSTYDHQIWQAGTSTGVELNETNQTGAGDLITSRSRNKLKILYLYNHSAYGYQTWQDGILPWCTPAHKVTRPFDYVFLWYHVTK